MSFFLRRVSEVFKRIKRAARNSPGVARSVGEVGVFENRAKEQPPPLERYSGAVVFWVLVWLIMNWEKWVVLKRMACRVGVMTRCSMSMRPFWLSWPVWVLYQKISVFVFESETS